MLVLKPQVDEVIQVGPDIQVRADRINENKRVIVHVGDVRLLVFLRRRRGGDLLVGIEAPRSVEVTRHDSD